MPDFKLEDLLNISAICPIIASSPVDAAVPAAQALCKGGIPAVEILLRDENAMTNIENVAKSVPGMYVGAGTVVTAEQAEIAIDHGANFIITPGLSRKIIELCLKRNVPVVPGCVTACELMTATEYGLTSAKFFPVYQLGGVSMMQQLNGPFPHIRFVVTGDLNGENFLPLVQYKGVLAAGGDWIFQEEHALRDRNYAQIEINARKSVYKVLDMREKQ